MIEGCWDIHARDPPGERPKQTSTNTPSPVLDLLTRLDHETGFPGVTHAEIDSAREAVCAWIFGW